MRVLQKTILGDGDEITLATLRNSAFFLRLRIYVNLLCSEWWSATGCLRRKQKRIKCSGVVIQKRIQMTKVNSDLLAWKVTLFWRTSVFIIILHHWMSGSWKNDPQHNKKPKMWFKSIRNYVHQGIQCQSWWELCVIKCYYELLWTYHELSIHLCECIVCHVLCECNMCHVLSKSKAMNQID